MNTNYIEAMKILEANINLIDCNQFSELYSKLKPHFTYIITEKLLEAEINPLNYINYIPAYYLAYTNRINFKIPDNIRSISPCAFLGSNLESIIIPEGVTFICPKAFEDCSELKSLSLPNSLRAIATNAFRNCHSLKDITYNGTIEEWKKIVVSITAFVTSINDYKAVQCIDGPITLRTS